MATTDAEAARRKPGEELAELKGLLAIEGILPSDALLSSQHGAVTGVDREDRRTSSVRAGQSRLPGQSMGGGATPRW